MVVPHDVAVVVVSGGLVQFPVTWCPHRKVFLGYIVVAHFAVIFGGALARQQKVQGQREGSYSGVSGVSGTAADLGQRVCRGMGSKGLGL